MIPTYTDSQTQAYLNFDDGKPDSPLSSPSRCRFYGELIKTVNITQTPSCVSRGYLPRRPHSGVWNQMYKFLNEILIRTLWPYAFSFHGNRKLTMPTEAHNQCVNEDRLQEFLLVRHFYRCSPHLTASRFYSWRLHTDSAVVSPLLSSACAV